MSNKGSCLTRFAEDLVRARQEHTLPLPSRSESRKFADSVVALLFPHFSDRALDSVREVEDELLAVRQALVRILTPIGKRCPLEIETVASRFVEALPQIREALLLDGRAIFEGDPAAESFDEVLLAYPGFFAIAIYRIAHEFYRMEVPIFPRILTEYAHRVTGIDIHPGATIGRSFFIDHGTGIVVGETTVIKDRVKLYQGVTLGALSVDKTMTNQKRHPTIEDDVVIYSNATVLGGETVIGHDSVIGGNVWVTASVPPFSTVYHKSEVSVRNSKGTTC